MTQAGQKRVPPALARLQGDKLTVAEKTKAVQSAAAAPGGVAPTPEQVARKDLTPREIPFTIEYEHPETGAIEVVVALSRVPDDDDFALFTRTSVAFAGGIPLDLMDGEQRDYFKALGRAFVQVRDPSDRLRELMLNPEVLYPLVERLVEHEHRFRLRGRKPGAPTQAKPPVVVHAPWDPTEPPGE